MTCIHDNSEPKLKNLKKTKSFVGVFCENCILYIIHVVRNVFKAVLVTDVIRGP